MPWQHEIITEESAPSEFPSFSNEMTRVQPYFCIVGDGTILSLLTTIE
jgi:hypothetical protein